MGADGQDGGDPERAPRRQLYGRSKGKALRAAQAARIDTLLPQVSLDLAALTPDPAALFPIRPERLVLEIGFGGGEHLAARAEAEPDTGFLGVEPFLNGVAKLLAAIETRGLTNVRLLRGDGRDVLAALPDGALDRVYLLYPDPWPKRRQRKRRIVDEAFLAALARVLKPGGEFRFATDIDDYAGWTLARIARQDGLVWTARTAEDWRRPWPDLHRTRYEEKALREGRVPGYFRFRRV
ncbi:tRNA (guanosine(46)-N7)-methyltransferase TrmB [Rhabdaerophilum calidifontis]|uniref:tRNA (guanosine(46)-N7)-methyltransferase TrmB n=1 Tax=Rhabdaerophilum calidifontis TaxID=2604328 RepID=UPI0012388240|nr:tRNA (guanosine(46)-N7)-methyltransferase TrmB [Rhabdaerophilum calidifontis]